MNKKQVILVIANYGNKQIPYLKTILQEYNNFKKYKIKVILLNTELIKNLNYSNLNIKQEIYDLSLGYWLAHKHRKFISENKDNFDIFIYSENDFLITEANLDTFVKHSKNLKNTKYVPGFLRYELKKNDNTKYLLDCHPNHAVNRIPLYSIIKYPVGLLPTHIALNFHLNPIIRQLNITINNKKYFEVQNLHQGCYILTKEQLKIVLDSGNYFNKSKNYVGARESAASNVYAYCNIVKVINQGDLESNLIHHLADKYADSHPTYIRKQTITLKELKKMLNTFN